MRVWLSAVSLDHLIRVYQSDRPLRMVKNKSTNLPEQMIRHAWFHVTRETAHSLWYIIGKAGPETLAYSLSLWLDKDIGLAEIDEGIAQYQTLLQRVRDVWKHEEMLRAQIARLAQQFYELWQDQIEEGDAIDLSDSLLLAWLTANRIPPRKHEAMLFPLRCLFQERNEKRRHEQHEAALVAAFQADVKARNLIEGAYYIRKYGLAHYELDVLPQILPYTELAYPIGRQRKSFYYDDRPLTSEEQTRLWEIALCSKGDAALRLKITEDQLTRLLKAHQVKAAEKRSGYDTVWRFNLYRVSDIEVLRPHVSTLKTKAPSQKHAEMWHGLTPAEQNELTRLFKRDQAAEEEQKDEQKRYMHASRPAAEWRWLALSVRNDRAVLESLAAKALILLEVEQAQMTRLGRAVVRAKRALKTETS